MSGRRFKIPLAHWLSKKDLVKPSHDLPYARLLQEGDSYVCPACQGTLKLAKGQIVPPYFAHAEGGALCSEGAALHKIAKLLLVKAVNEWVAGGEAPKVERFCGRCRRRTEVPPPAGTACATEDFSHEGRARDVALLDAQGAPLLFLEVFVTRRAQPSAAPWIELNAREVIETPLLWSPMNWGGLEDVNGCEGCTAEEASGYQSADPLNPHLFDVADMVFGANGLLAQVMEDYEERPSQLMLAKAVDQAIKTRTSLLAEGPCGTGKGAAYLSVSIAHALHVGGKVLVSTTNKALQDQLYDNDVPQIAEVMDRNVKCALMRGRSNYVCQRRLTEWSSEVRQGDSEIVSWAARSEDGDMERAGFEIDPDVRRAVCGNRSACGDACTSKSSCFYQKAKRRAKAADVIITNHAQLFAHFIWRARLGKNVVLPDAEITVCDEGHELADNARKFFEISITEGRAARVACFRTDKKPLYDADAKFFEAVRRATARDSNITEPWINGQAQVAAEHYLDLVAGAVLAWEGALERASEAWDEDEIKEAETGLERAETLGRRLTAICNMKPSTETGTPMVYWVERTGAGRTKILGCPVEVSQFIHDNLFHGRATVVTSATLTSSGSFDHVIEDLGFVGNTLAVESPFDFNRQALLALPTDVEMPVDPSYKNRDEFIVHATRLFQWIAHYSGGGVLFLFASRKSMHEVRRNIDPRFPHKILMQGEGGVSKKALTGQFKDDKSSCLFGLASFWAGLDVPGDALRCVVIEKLPFCTPKDPFYQYWVRKKGKRQAMADYMIQRAMIQLRQGAGRLIRKSSDRGVLVMLDRRIRSRPGRSDYSKYMQPSIPWPHAWGIESVQRFFAPVESL